MIDDDQDFLGLAYAAVFVEIIFFMENFSGIPDEDKYPIYLLWFIS